MNSVNHNKLLKSIPCVQISHVTKRFGEDLVLKEVNLDLNYGQVYGIVGNNGSGKTVFKDTRWSSGRGRTVEHTELAQHRGILYITNQRIVFQATEWGFDKTYRYLTAITPYSNACEMQFGNKSYCIVVADGNVVNQVLQLIKQRRQVP